jgi:hypothetical protein
MRNFEDVYDIYIYITEIGLTPGDSGSAKDDFIYRRIWIDASH